MGGRLLEGLEILFRSPTNIALNSIQPDNKMVLWFSFQSSDYNKEKASAWCSCIFNTDLTLANILISREMVDPRFKVSE